MHLFSDYGGDGRDCNHTTLTTVNIVNQYLRYYLIIKFFQYIFTHDAQYLSTRSAVTKVQPQSHQSKKDPTTYIPKYLPIKLVTQKLLTKPTLEYEHEKRSHIIESY